MRRITNVCIVIIAVRRPDIIHVVLPRAGTDDARRALAIEPGGAIDGRRLIGLVPAIRDPLSNAAAHIIETEGIGFDAANRHRLRGIVGLIASLAVGHTNRGLITPPIFGLRASARGVLPFGLARKAVLLLSDARKPLGKLLCVIPAHIGDCGVVLARHLVGAFLGGNALVPLADRDRKLAN